TLYDLGGGGIRIGTVARTTDTDDAVSQHVLVQDTLVRSADRHVPGVGIWIEQAHDVLVDHCEVADVYNVGIDLRHSLNFVPSVTHDNTIQYTSIHDLGQGVTSDLGCIHTATSMQLGNRISHVICHDVTADPDGYGGWGMYLDQGTSFVDVDNMLVYN